MLDSASTSNFITNSCVSKLNLPRRKTHVSIQGMGESNIGNAKGITNISFCTHFDITKAFVLEAFIVQKITSKIPESRVDFRRWSHIKNLQLADPDFYIPADVDILIGAEYYFEIVNGEKKMDSLQTPFAINSALGWLIGGGRNPGPMETTSIFHTNAVQPNVQHNKVYQPLPEQQLDELLKKFWELESCPRKTKLSAEEELCEQHFLQTYRRDESGRFIVKFPFKSPKPQLGESLPIAIRRLKQVERRLSSNTDYQNEYSKFMEDYESLGHMVEVLPPTATSKFRCYLPHHFVLKESSTTTKFRVVFDASAKTSNGVSLNDTMLVGPTIQDSIANLIMRFRKHKIAITADIEKMYRQILMDPEEQELQHIVWREAPGKPIRHFRLRTVTYGTAAGPYLATKVLHTLADIEHLNFPEAAKVLKEDFYIDDVMAGTAETTDAIGLQQNLIQLLNKGQFAIRKFTSNSERVLQSLPEELRETKTLSFDKDAGVKALGIFWNPSEDYFGFKTAHLCKISTEPQSKRQILSEISQLFDPIGWLSPVVINAKILMQSIWKEDVEWDKPVPLHISNKWNKFKSSLIDLQSLKIPRAQICIPNSTYLVGFSDASEKAYCATIFLCTYQNGINSVHLVTSKTRVAPVKTQSLPRLELCGAMLLAKLLPTVAKALNFNFTDILAYTDSTLVLAWIQSEPFKYKTFIANRITKIQKRIPSAKWGFVRGVDNPADCGSRGISVEDFLNHPLWWSGSPWLPQQPLWILPEKIKPIVTKPELLELKTPSQCFKITTKLSQDLFNKYSSVSTLQRVVAYVMRYIQNLKTKCINRKPESQINSECSNGRLTLVELSSALMFLIAVAQEQEFSTELHQLKNKKELASNSKILPLAPFLDECGILRVGGRLRHARISISQKHPILLPQHHKLTQLIIQEAHIANLHASSQTLLSILQQRYWIPRGKDTVRKVIKPCIVCTKLKAVTMEQMMADLPSFRVNPSHPFQNCGVDYAGPFLIRPITPRSKTTIKAYICIFICCATRAIHLEVVSDATTAAFIACLRRFTSRRGRPSNIYSDNGTNFVGANKEILEFKKLIQSDDHNNEVSRKLSKEGISWHFNPPAAPHFGGLWEAGVKSTKYHLKRVMGLNRLTFEEMTTLTTQIEAILNSRPLTPESTDPSDLRALTPGHFLIGQPLTAIPDPDVTNVPTNRLVRWQLVQQMAQQFWKRWSAEYVSRLQQRPKWLKPKEQIQIGSMVIIKEENMPPLEWKLGRIMQLHYGADGKVRTVTVKTCKGECKRPIVKICQLAIENSTT